MSDQTLRNRVTESAKLGVRGLLQRVDLDLRRSPFSNRVAAALDHLGVEHVLDVGANVGQYARSLRGAGYSGAIVSCEPLEGAHRVLARRSRGDGRWITRQVAVGAEPGSIEINVSANSYSSSLLAMTDRHRDAAPGSGYIARQTVPATTVAALVEEHGIDPRRALLKVDTQGFEEPVLRGAGGLLDQFAAVQLELSYEELYEGQALQAVLEETMQRHGLRLYTLEPGLSDEHGRLLQADGLFAR